MKRLQKKYRLLKDIVIPAGTIFDCVDGETREYAETNYSTLHGLTKDSCGEFIYGGIGDDEKLNEWFEEAR